MPNVPPAPSTSPPPGRDVVRRAGDVRYLELRARALVGRCGEPDTPFDWTANPYRGCSMGCRYCYAAYTHDFLGRDALAEFHSLVYVKTGGEEETRRRLGIAARRREPIAIGTATDPYQPGESASRVTRRLLELACEPRGLEITLTTKSALVLRDVDLLQRIQERSRVSIAVSLVSLHPGLMRRLEPWAPPPEVRIEVLRRLRACGIDAGLALAPVLPGLTDREADLDRLFAAVAQAGVRRLSWQLLFLRSPTREKYFEWVEREFPDRLPAYLRAYEGRTHLRGDYPRRLSRLIARLRAKHHLELEMFGRRDPRRLAEQLGLWD